MIISMNLERRSKYGKYHDLSEYLEDLQEDYFEHKDLGLTIKWSRWPKKDAIHLSLGRYHPDRALILINPVLDSKEVPRYFVKYIIFHEMLHHLVPSEVTENGAEILHSATYKEAESKYKYYTRAINWEIENVQKFYRARK